MSSLWSSLANVGWWEPLVQYSTELGRKLDGVSALWGRLKRSATIWASGRSRNPYFVVFLASLLFGSRF